MVLSGRKTCLSRVMVENTICSSERKHKQQYIVVYRAPKREILFSKESTEGIESGQVTALDYDDETLRAESAEEVKRQWAD